MQDFNRGPNEEQAAVYQRCLTVLQQKGIDEDSVCRLFAHPDGKGLRVIKQALDPSALPGVSETLLTMFFLDLELCLNENWLRLEASTPPNSPPRMTTTTTTTTTNCKLAAVAASASPSLCGKRSASLQGFETPTSKRRSLVHKTLALQYDPQAMKAIEEKLTPIAKHFRPSVQADVIKAYYHHPPATTGM